MRLKSSAFTERIAPVNAFFSTLPPLLFFVPCPPRLLELTQTSPAPKKATSQPPILNVPRYRVVEDGPNAGRLEKVADVLYGQDSSSIYMQDGQYPDSTLLIFVPLSDIMRFCVESFSRLSLYSFLLRLFSLYFR